MYQPHIIILINIDTTSFHHFNAISLQLYIIILTYRIYCTQLNLYNDSIRTCDVCKSILSALVSKQNSQS